MCKTCGCGDEAQAKITNMQTGKQVDIEEEIQKHAHAGEHAYHNHPHTHADGTTHGHSHEADDHYHGGAVQGQILSLQQRLLAKNDAIAAQNRAWLQGREILALNIMSSPGAGKTTLLERTIAKLKDDVPLFVIEGDQATSVDGERIRAAGASTIQVNTGAGCHLEADMIARGLMELRPPTGSIVMIENVGNLVCPALFDLGESCKIVMLSVTEGEDKPLKYPHMFQAARLMIINKIDLAPYVEFDRGRCLANAHRVNPHIEVVELSSKTGEGILAWRAWLLQELARMSDVKWCLDKGIGP
ncbi:hydrogenase nickel incorporation protein HypB [Methylocystis parvus]|uniref:Hydrogenase maturation factor HypB n=1 Tax=Methylocystis parvus TaxID=134 RepID=A0A6B8MF46_9HYPH|nr:hydrogenase nickel incorporation protein HypB [Methylocystis parvus]QGN00160.1 hydrogenase nickel incorporation protein HypB [Methylocystis parvus]WBK02532.1 hydrogenase nickel incorporation protein HypB [Methylocystis parvus OBBP]